MSVTAISSPPPIAVRSHRLGSPRRGFLRPIAAARSGTGYVAPILTTLNNECATPLPVLRRVADAMASDMKSGLAVDGGGDLQMILSYVDTLPTGNEKGLYYALDLGGTNFRVLRVQLGGKDERVIATEFEQVSIPPELMLGKSEELFDFIATGLARFAEKEGEKFHLLQGRKREVGFTFSFPLKQTSVDSGTLIKWTKGFAVSGMAGRDVVACLNEAMERQGLEMKVSALVNDTVATFAGARYWDDDVMVAVILGTGTNACYVERMDSIGKLHGHNSSSGNMIINTEWGAFSNGLPLTEFDKEMDAASINPGEQVQSEVSARRIVLEVCDAIVKRGGRLAGAGIVGILEKMEEDSKGLIFGKRTVVAMDGGLYENYPQYRMCVQSAVDELLGHEKSKNVVIEHSKDGSGIGAALLAAANSKHGREF